jgi:hypothetical protein
MVITYINNKDKGGKEITTMSAEAAGDDGTLVGEIATNKSSDVRKTS